MMTTMAAMGLAASLALTQQATDTTFAVAAGARLQVENFAGEVRVGAWDRNAVRVRAEHGSTDRIEIEPSASLVRVRARAEHGPPPIVNLELTIPKRMSLDLNAPFSDVIVQGTEGEVGVQSVEGAITVIGGRGFVSVQSVEGAVRVEGSRGRVRINSVDEDVQIVRVTGEVFVQAIDGNVTLEGIDSDHVEASSVDGSIEYHGTIKDGGRYRFTTHDGDILLSVPPNVNAQITVATFSGEFESDFPVVLKDTGRGKRFSFVLGSGSAQVELQAFDGTIQLQRSRR